MNVPSFSFWPLTGSGAAFLLTFGGVYWWHNSFSLVLLLAPLAIFCTMMFWWRDILNEGFCGFHTVSFITKLHLGVILFMLSEVVFFGSFFWGFFHKCWSPSEELGFVWPPLSFEDVVLDPFSVPLLNTVILLSSGVTVTSSHYYFLVSPHRENFFFCVVYLFTTVLLGMFFLIIQLEEYQKSFISFNSSSYGSAFFILTGFHGFHVILGTVLLFVVFIRLMNKSFSSFDHLGFEAAAWYWHFVDVVWLFLFMFVYWLGFNL